MSLSEAKIHRRARSLTIALFAALCGGVSAAAFTFVAPEGSSPLVPMNEKQGQHVDNIYPGQQRRLRELEAQRRRGEQGLHHRQLRPAPPL